MPAAEPLRYGALQIAGISADSRRTILSQAAFALMVLAELAILLAPQMSRRLGIVVIILAIVGAVKFTGWYPERARR